MRYISIQNYFITINYYYELDTCLDFLCAGRGWKVDKNDMTKAQNPPTTIQNTQSNCISNAIVVRLKNCK